MRSLRTLLSAAFAATALAAIATPVAASASSASGYHLAQKKPSGDQNEARREMRAGNAKSLREIERMILPRMKGAEYLGPSYDSSARAYRLKFIRKGRVVYIDVDARTGRIISRSR